MGEAHDALRAHARGCGELLDGGAGPDAGLDVTGAQRVGHLDLDFDLRLVAGGPVAADGGLQSIIDAQDKLVCGGRTVGGFADDALAVGVESDDLEFPHW
ncbi:Uncharacterised protein [Mycobacteroides abscessus subsp. abscessus]|nr:Uncharacterised protein [Mycobacteroides abscessus subsp. abscessus]